MIAQYENTPWRHTSMQRYGVLNCSKKVSLNRVLFLELENEKDK